MNSLLTGIDISRKTNVAYLIRPDGSKYSSFAVQNDQGGTRILLEGVMSALNALQLDAVFIGMEATSIYRNNLV